ncbi:hypothetical protein HOT99_gp277 [Caulobacter phage CcrBL10]|uniref:Uncharacterized protein n=1 Tax=Caulobacter phage CcrBL10 TaxID=2283269 RepID=A0A385E9J5_9CAUD|nr:hypothetical protein HOT99_gp277 [Caulobacter phage CcrBL10]AXQ68340.1 hypothetical protein CcrBL10_gp136 [Caulobacter phage CcrBL10]
MASEIEERLDPKLLAPLIYRYFYNGPVGGAAQRLARIIRNHAMGLPIMTFDEVFAEYLADRFGLDEDAIAAERAVFWKAMNGMGEPDPIDRFYRYAQAKELLDCVKVTLEKRRPQQLS